MKLSRRDLLTRGAALTGATVVGSTISTPSSAASSLTDNGVRYKDWEQSYSGGSLDVEPLEPGLPGKHYQPVVVPNGGAIPFRIIDGVKVFHMIVEPVAHEFTPGMDADMWGYNGRVNASIIEAVEGERIRIYVTNKLDVPTTVHWHGLYLPNGMDGVAGVTQPVIKPGETFKYEWTLRQFGTFMYHAHYDTMTQEAMGLTGMFIVHPRNPQPEDQVDRDFVLLMNEYKLEPGTRRVDPNEMTDFNVLTLNGRAFPGTDPLTIKQNQRVRVRIGNLSAMDHHPFHIHGYRFKVTATDGERIPASAQWPETSVLVAVGQTREIEFIADAPGDWIAHCHMTHHTMTQMGHGLTNMMGMDIKGLMPQVNNAIGGGYMPMGEKGMYDMAFMQMDMPENSRPMAGVPLQYGKGTMGGLFTIFKVREELSGYDDPGWYKHPKGTVASLAKGSELRKDGIKV
ncbi:MAG: copper oxidase [Gammaproteobacteria bacterium]|nr:copper oxidase [Gammaproteobacteria bacterium]